MAISVRVIVGTGGLLGLLMGVAACAKGEGLMARKTIEAVLREHTDRLMALPGVVGTAIGECAGNPCIKVLVVEETPELVNEIPPTLDGYLVVMEETGEIRALPPR